MILRSRNRAGNLLVRVFTGGLRLLLLLYLAKYLDQSDFIDFGIIQASILFSTSVATGELHNYTSRLCMERKWSNVQSSLISHVRIIFVFLGLWLCLHKLIFGSIYTHSYSLMLYFFVFFLEIFNQELSRFLVAMDQQFSSSVAIFIRSSIWVPLLYLFNLTKIDDILLVWFLFSTASFLYGLRRILKCMDFRGRYEKIRYFSIRDALATSSKYLVISVAVTGIATYDKILVNLITDKNIVASYFFFATLSSIPMTIVVSMLLSYLKPHMMRVKENIDMLDKVLKINIAITMLVYLILSIVGFISLDYLLIYLENEYMIDYKFLFLILMISGLFNAMAMIYQSKLYVLYHDNFILKINVIIGFIFILASLSAYFTDQYFWFVYIVAFTQLVRFLCFFFCRSNPFS